MKHVYKRFPTSTDEKSSHTQLEWKSGVKDFLEWKCCRFWQISSPPPWSVNFADTAKQKLIFSSRDVTRARQNSISHYMCDKLQSNSANNVTTAHDLHRCVYAKTRKKLNSTKLMKRKSTHNGGRRETRQVTRVRRRKSTQEKANFFLVSRSALWLSRDNSRYDIWTFRNIQSTQ